MLASHLIHEKQDVVVIDSDPKRANDIQSRLDCLVIIGSGTNIDFLREAEVAKADFFIAVTDSDETNLVACGLVETIRSEVTTIAAIRNLTYVGKDGLPTTILGINHIVNPEAETALSIHTFINRGIVSDAITFEKSNLVLYNIFVGPKSRFANQSIADCRSSIGTEFVIAAMYRKGEAIVPHGDTIVHSEDTLAIAAADDGREALFNIIGQKKVAPKKIVIVGGSKIARFLLKSFKSSELRNIALVEQNPQVCDSFASLFPNLLVIRSDITDETIFEEELLNRYDLLISLTDSDELNVITASYAKSEGVGSTIALIKRNNNYSRLARHLNIDSIISVSEATVDSLLKYMRGKHVSSVHSLFNGLFEVFESEVSKEMKICGKKIEQLNIQKKAIICGITKSDKTNIIPTGSYKIESGDILLVCAERSQLTTVQKVFLQ